MEGASVGSCRLGLTRRACIYLLEARIGAWAKAQSAVAIVNLVAQPEVSFAIHGVKAFDGEAFRPEQDVWIEDGRIRRVGEGLDLPEDLLRVDGRGRTLVPGLIDGHVHTYGSTLNDAVRFGVTTVLDQFTNPGLAAAKRPARDELARGDEADLFSAGMLAAAPGGHGTQYGVPVEPVGRPDDAPAWVRARKTEGSDWIKIVWEDGSTFGMAAAASARGAEQRRGARRRHLDAGRYLRARRPWPHRRRPHRRPRPGERRFGARPVAQHSHRRHLEGRLLRGA